jgi:hypothetical protein
MTDKLEELAAEIGEVTEEQEEQPSKTVAEE